MQQTANYNLNLPEGTDVVNPLVDYNPNFSTIDSAMKANADRTVGRATCIKSGTTHVVTRSNTGSNIINFTATGDWNEGDTMTIDSTLVSVFLPDGTAALDGAYLINSEVFGILNGTRFTLYSNVVDIPTVTANSVTYDNTSSGLTATDVQSAIDEIDANVDTLSGKKLTYGPWVSSGPGVTAPENCQLWVSGVGPSSGIGVERIVIGGMYVCIVAPSNFTGGGLFNVKKGETWSYVDGTLVNLNWQYRTVTIE